MRIACAFNLNDGADPARRYRKASRRSCDEVGKPVDGWSIPDPTSADTVAFGSTVTFSRSDGRVQKYRIVGEDEADPKAGTISFVSPIAKMLMGKAAGDLVETSGRTIEIIDIS